MSGGPWDDRVAFATDSPTTRTYRAMRKAGLRPLKISDESEPGHWVGSRMLFRCGCVRVYRANQRTLAETEWAEPCELHGNLLTSLDLLVHNPGIAGGKDRPEQQENPDDARDSDHH